MMNEEKTKSFAVSKQMVYNSYLNVCDKNGGAGIDKETIEIFNTNLSCNLYKVWNRMASGSYFPPPVRTVLIPKKQGGKRPLGIPTVGDRIAQGVVKDYLEPILEPLFHNSSYGYRPGRSAHDALGQCQHHCIHHEWVIDLDIKGFFDNISHEWLMKMLAHHTEEKWVLLYVKRWLEAGVEQEDGSIAARTQGTPQGGVISPLLANLYLHHSFDMWMDKNYSSNPFERYADDIIVHCNSETQAKELLALIRERLLKFGLTLHPDKTKIVYCKNYTRKGSYEHEAFTFLSYTFQPRARRNKYGRKNKFMVFSGAISCAAKAFVKARIRAVFNPRNIMKPLAETAKQLNPKIRGWLNYYCRYNAVVATKVFEYLNELIRRWLAEKYKLRNKKAVIAKYQNYVRENEGLFVHWQRGVKY
jgi:RNA-directed DNA polymerase